MARRSQCSSAGDNPLDPNYLPPHYREEYRLAIDALVEEDVEGYYQFLQKANVVDFLSAPEIQHIQNSVQAPKQQSSHPELHFLERGDDGSSDTYWPIHSDQEVPGLDLGWPQLRPFIEPTEVITLINPPEPDMPSIKEQARRLIKNAQQVVAVVMDMFTDVDMFADILNAAQRNVAVYILLDEQNVHHFINMVSNCRVDLQSIQFLCVRTVSGITYQCRTGKSLKGQMMDRFLLTDCRAVLSGNYSFMWSFEKLHRCMAHLFLGQLVTTFDEEFRILFAQSQPLVVEQLAPVEDLGLLHKRQYPNERTPLYREPRKFLTGIGQTDEWVRHSYDERKDGDWRMAGLKRQESFHGPADIYSRLPSQQSRMDPCLDQGLSRIGMLENPAHKRHSYAEGVHGRYSFLQQGMPDSEPQEKHFHRGQQPYPGPGPEGEYGAHDKFWNHGYHSADQYSEPGLAQDMQPSENFDPVLNYLSSTRNLDFDQSSEKSLPVADLPFSSSQPRRLSLDQPYVHQTSPTPSNSADQKTFFLGTAADRKDPTVKRGLRNWRISSYLSAYENPKEEGLPLASPQAPDAFEDSPNPMQQSVPGIDASFPKIPNVREFKVAAITRASQMPSYAKTAIREQPKKLLDEPAAVAAETKATPTPSEVSPATEGEKTEEAEQKEPKTAVLRRDDSFKRNYNAALQRSSRLRSSLIFSSLDQQQTQDTSSTDQQDEQSEKNEAAQTKTPFVSHVFGQKKSATREPIEWSRYIKSATVDNSSTETLKADDKKASKEESKDSSANPEAQEPIKLSDAKQDSPSVPQSKISEAELQKTDQPVQQPKPLLPSQLFLDMNNPDNRLMFFKELAAKRKAEAAEAEKRKEKAKLPAKVETTATFQKKEPIPKESPESLASVSEGLVVKNAAAQGARKTVSTEAGKSATLSLDAGEKTSKKGSPVSKDSNTSHSCSEQTVELFIKESSDPAAPTDAPPADVSSVAQGVDDRETPKRDSTSKEFPSSPVLDGSAQLEADVCSPPKTSKPDAGSGLNTSSDHTLLDCGSQISPSTPGETSTEIAVKGNSSSAHSPGIPSPKSDETEAQESVSTLLQASSQSVQETKQKSNSPASQTESSAPTPSAEASENDGSLLDVAEGSGAVGSSKDVKTESASPSFSSAVPESGLLGASGVESSVSEPDSEEPTAPITTTAGAPPKPSVSETSSLVNTDFTPNASLSETTASPQETSIQATPPHHLNLTDPPTPAETEASPRPSESDGSRLSETEKTETNISALDSVSDKKCLSRETQPELDLPCKAAESDTAESDTSEPHVSLNGRTAESEVADTSENKSDNQEDANKSHDSGAQESVSKEKTNDQVKPNNCSESAEITSKQPKSSQSRYHSSTANVLSSSNLRDDTKLLLEQISANCQSRSEATKESPVTDDEKEDEADKNAKKEKERGFRTLSRGQSKSPQERDKLLERIQSMRKERKVYSRFEMAP
ncbi:protein FAM83H isoform X2 [Leuresthes tenuis]|uniref:protein FAM83H isoform X2 n=1 Tax=Leuresthes tenuis TaxID=355514 RepID=UPI003B50B298